MDRTTEFDASSPEKPGRPETRGEPAGTLGAARMRRVAAPPLWLGAFRPGMRVAVAVSGGADSVGLLRALVEANAAPRAGLGLVMSVAHVHHGIRGSEADTDAAFVAALAAGLGLRLERTDVDTPSVAQSSKVGLEEAARILRYGWFAELLSTGVVDSVATAHTLNDQAETVLHKLIRGAWTEGLGGIHPVLESGAALRPDAPNSAEPGRVSGRVGARIVRPLLGATREQVVAWLTSIGQPWREDATNADMTYTRNRIRHQLLPQLATFNPRIAHQLAQVATIARDEEAYWQKEVERLLPGLLLPGRAVRGGGRASSTLPGERSLAIEVERLRGQHPALVRRLLRAAAKELGAALDFEETARLLDLVEGTASANPRREELTGELRAERTPRELRLVFSAGHAKTPEASTTAPIAVEIPVSGEGEAFGWLIRCSLADEAPLQAQQPAALLRAALPTDRVQLRYSRGAPKRIKEVLERMGVPADERSTWPVLIWQGEIVWMRGAVLEPTPISSLLTIAAEQRW